MAFNYRFFIDDVEIDEPQGWDSFKISIVRDENLHGIGFESSTGTLEFTGNAIDYIDSVKASQGLKAQMIFLAEQDCDNSGEYTPVIQGQLDMTQYKKNCGSTCFISLPVLMSSCEATLTNRYTQQFDMGSNTSQNGLTPITPYSGLGVTIILPTKDIDYKSDGAVDPNGDVETVEFADPGGGSEAYVLVRPEYVETDTNIVQTNLTGGTNVGYAGPHGIFIPISAQVLFGEDNAECFQQPFLVTGRLKGTITMPGVSNLDVYGVLLNGEISGTWPINDPAQNVQQITLGTNVADADNWPFDWTIDPYEWNPKNNGTDAIYLYIALHQHPGANFGGAVFFSTESFFSAVTIKSCPPTPVKSYMIHEALSRATENITDGCVRVKSSYYGRTDSEPFSFPEDGCGGLRMVSSGLKIRNAPPPTDTFFTNLSDLVTGLQSIDNVGMGLEDDEEIPGGMVARIEDLDFFYQDIEVFECLGINNATYAVESDRDFSIIQIGYKTWQTQADFGLDEFNSDREYHLNISALNKTLDIRSVLVAGEYAFEVTREQQWADTSSADTTYDNNVFICCLKRAGGYTPFVVEQGGIINPQNIFNPNSVYNYRISPLRNLMRWYRTLIAAYPTLADSTNKLYFSSGTGNLQASGQLAEGYGYGSAFCKLEGVDIKENMDLFTTAFNDVAEYVPLWANETIQFDYPMSVADYNKIKANRYGYISYQCGNGAISQGWIKDIEYTPNDGSATITLRQRWGK